MHPRDPQFLAAARATLARAAGPSLPEGSVFEALAAHTPVGIFISSVEDGCLYVNDRWCDLAGLTHEEAMGDGWARALHPEDAPSMNREWSEAAAQGRDSAVEYRFLRPDGSVSWIEGYAATLRDGDGRVIGWVGTCLDLTARKEAEEATARAAERFRVAFDSAPIGMALLTPDGRWLQANPALCELVGYSEDELRDLSFTDITHPDDRATSIERRRRQLAGAPEPRIEKRYLRSDGAVVWVAVSSTVVRDGGGDPLYTVAQIEDITDRLRTQRALVEAEEQFHRAFDDAPVGMALASPAGTWLEVNPAFCRLLGYTEEQLSQLSYLDVTHPDDIEASVEHSRRQLDGEVEELRIEKRFVRSDKKIVWVALTSTLTRDAAGQPHHFVAQIEDVTDRVLAQKALEEAEERFRRAFEDAPIGMGLVSLDGRWLRVNRTLCEITGYTEEALLARTFQDITHPDDLDDNLGQVRKAIAGETGPMRFEKRYVRPDGHPVWVRVSSSIVRDADGVPLHFVSQIEDVTDRRHDEEKLKDLADHDSLTGLLNRRRFDEELWVTILRLRRHGGHAALMLIDLDRFKPVNDVFGHKTGDEVLVAVADALRGRMRETDAVARLGGDEFAVLLHHADADGARTVATVIAAALRAIRVVSDGTEVGVTASIGIVLLDRSTVGDADDALVAADRALYQAKDEGRDAVVLAA